MAISNNNTGIRTGVCTSTTRPTAPYEGQHIYETDTDIEYVWNGSAWVVNYVSANSPAFTGTPTAPTASAGTDTTQLATTAFVVGQASAVTPTAIGAGAVGTSITSDTPATGGAGAAVSITGSSVTYAGGGGGGSPSGAGNGGWGVGQVTARYARADNDWDRGAWWWLGGQTCGLGVVWVRSALAFRDHCARIIPNF
jgi:hypothetical protein